MTNKNTVTLEINLYELTELHTLVMNSLIDKLSTSADDIELISSLNEKLGNLKNYVVEHTEDFIN